MTANSVLFQGSTAIPRHTNPTSGWLSQAMGKSASREAADSYKALIVDDNPDVLGLAAQLFRLLGYEVLTADNGANALKLLGSTPDIAVLFTDVVMPVMSGIQLGYEARKLIPNIHVILVSGYPNPAAIAGHGNLHDFDFLRKPYRFADIVKLLAKPS